MEIEVILLGTGVGVPQPGRSQSALLIRGEKPLLFDCGAGTLMRLSQAGVDPLDLGTVVLTHLHLDHVSDLLALANARYLKTEGEAGMEIFGPIGTDQYVRMVHDAYPYLAEMKLSVHEIDDGDRLSIKGFDIKAASAAHSVTALAYRIEQGSKVIAYSGDTEPSKKVADLARGADLLIHECSFPEPYEVTNHSTPKNLGSMVDGVKKIVLTHFYPEAMGHEDEMVQDLRASLREEVPVEAGRDLQVINA
ncbi:MAG TPA: MBL fold metallo-hydrolase [Methanotrichaceae archaeon]|nr:MBL fold metallo-hydrolase [Methanotrichaceae archaeon]